MKLKQDVDLDWVTGTVPKGAKMLGGIAFAAHVRGCEVVVVARSFDELLLIWKILLPGLTIIKSKCRKVMLVDRNNVVIE